MGLRFRAYGLNASSFGVDYATVLSELSDATASDYSAFATLKPKLRTLNPT